MIKHGSMSCEEGTLEFLGVRRLQFKAGTHWRPVASAAYFMFPESDHGDILLCVNDAVERGWLTGGETPEDRSQHMRANSLHHFRMDQMQTFVEARDEQLLKKHERRKARANG